MSPSASAKACWFPKNSTASCLVMSMDYRQADIKSNRRTDSRIGQPIGMSTIGVGGRLKRARKERKATQVEVAKAAGISQPTLSDIETGETQELSARSLVGACVFLKVRPEWVMTGKGEMSIGEADHLTDDEKQLLKKYREASPRWRMALQHLAALRSDAQDEVSEGTMVLLAKVAADAVPDEKLGPEWTSPAARKS